MNKVSVKIDGIEYQIVGEKNEAEIVKVAKYIDGELKQINKAAPSLSKINAAILTSVNIADKFFDSKAEVEDLKKKIQLIEDSYSNRSDDVEKEFDSILLKLDEAEAKTTAMKGIISELEEKLKVKEESIKKLVDEKSVENSVGGEDSEKLIKSLEMKLKEMEKKVAVAESMATEFQNKAYNIQLNYEELKNSTK